MAVHAVDFTAQPRAFDEQRMLVIRRTEHPLRLIDLPAILALSRFSLCGIAEVLQQGFKLDRDQRRGTPAVEAMHLGACRLDEKVTDVPGVRAALHRVVQRQPVKGVMCQRAKLCRRQLALAWIHGLHAELL